VLRAARAMPGVEEVMPGAYRRSFSQDGRHGIVEVRRDGDAEGLEVRVRYPEPTVLLPVANRVRAMFDLAAEPATIAEHFRRDSLLRRLVQRYPGLRVPGAWASLGPAVRALLGRQVTVAAASTIAGQIARSLGQPLSLLDTGGLSLVFPAAQTLAQTTLTGMPQLRARAIRSVAQAW